MDYSSYIEMIRFSEPFWFYFYVIISSYIVLSNKLSITNLLRKLKLEYTYKHPYFDAINSITNSNEKIAKRNNNFASKLYYLAILGLLCVSLAAPFHIGEKLPDPPDNRDIVFLVDNEINMVLKDYFIDNKRVDRLTMVKSVLVNFANKLSGNRISIVTFSEEAHTLLPFTVDTNLIKSMIPRIEATLTGRTSNPQKALLYTLNYLHNVSDNKSKHNPTIVLITDVLRPPRDIDPLIVAKYIKQKEFPFYVVAIGANTYKAEDIENSGLIYHPASFDRLKDIAVNAGGKFYWTKDTNSLSEVIKEILKSKKSKVIKKPIYIEVPLFKWPLLAAMLLILFQYIFSLVTIRARNA